MRITDVTAWYPDGAVRRPGWRRALWQIAVAVHTDDGLVGYGCGGGGVAAVAIIAEHLREELIGRDPLDRETLWDDLYRVTIPYGRRGLAIMAISGIDLALWDIAGKAAGKSVAALLGGPKCTRLPAYATLGAELGELPPGFRGLKINMKAGPADGDAGMDRNERWVADVRERIGMDRFLAIDVWMKWDAAYTLAMLDRLTRYDIAWFEDPLPPDDGDGYCRLQRERPDITWAGANHEFTRYGFRPWIDERRVDIVQPDVTWCGGLTETLRIEAMAQQAGLETMLHRGGEIWGLHLAAARGHRLAEIVMGPERQWPTDPGVVGAPTSLDADGLLTLPHGPGWGVTVKEPTA